MPPMPAESIKTAYPAIQATEHLTLEDLLLQLVAIQTHLMKSKCKSYPLFVAQIFGDPVEQFACDGRPSDQ